MAGHRIPIFAESQSAQGLYPPASSNDEQPPADAISSSAESRPGTFEPSPADVAVARAILQRGPKFPTEIVDVILDEAEYWPHSTTVVDFKNAGGSKGFLTGSGGPSENRLILRCPPVGMVAIPGGGDDGDGGNHTAGLGYTRETPLALPLEKKHPRTYFEDRAGGSVLGVMNPVRRITFTILSHDQGWGGIGALRGRYHGSWTWFEVGLERFDSSRDCGRDCTLHADPASSFPFCSLRPLHPRVESFIPPPIEDGDSSNSDGGDGGESPAPVPVPAPASAPDTAPAPAPDTAPAPAPQGRPIHYRLEHPLVPVEEYLVQRNKVAMKKSMLHRVVWSWRDETKDVEALARVGRGVATGQGDFVRSLKLGDVVTLWAKARFPGWENVVEGAKVDIYWAA